MRYLYAAIPAAVGVALTILLISLGDRRTLVSETALPAVWAGIGIAVSAVIVLIIILRDRLAAERQRVRAATLEDERDSQARFLARLDHELKNPVTAMLAGLSNLDAVDPAVASIRSQAERLSRLVGDLRRLAEVRTVTLDIAPVDLEELAEEVRDAASELPEAAERSIGIVFPRAPRPIPAVAGDYDLLFLATVNLVSNALKFSAPGDTIEVRASEADGIVTLEVADTGLGIRADEQERVWEELARGTDTLAIPGSGLGLPFVKAIVERHDGTVQLWSRSGEGTSVRLSLPVRAAADRQS